MFSCKPQTVTPQDIQKPFIFQQTNHDIRPKFQSKPPQQQHIEVWLCSEVTTGGCEVTDGGIVAAGGNNGNSVTGNN